MAITHPTNYVSVRRLGRYKQKLDGEYASQAGLDEVKGAIGTDTGYDFVDLGLPSGTLWAKCNIGATVETGYGNYYMYGKGTTQYNYGDTPYAGTEDPLDATKDTATQVVGDGWHMPTKAQWEELIANTTRETVTINEVLGAKFTAQNGNYIFLPFGGCYDTNGDKLSNTFADYWSCTPAPSSSNAYELYIGSNRAAVESKGRSHGYMIRAAKNAASVYDNLHTKASKSDTYTKTEVDNKRAYFDAENHRIVCP